MNNVGDQGVEIGGVWVMVGTSDPNGSISAVRSSMFLRKDTGSWYQNTDGSTTWAIVSPSSQVLAVGSNSTSAILLAGGTVDVTVTLSTTFPSTSYQWGAFLGSGSVSILGTLTLNKKSQTVSTVTVTLKNTGLISIASGQTVDVIALNP